MVTSPPKPKATSGSIAVKSRCDDQFGADPEADPEDHTTWTAQEFAEHCAWVRSQGAAEAARRAAAAIRELRIDPDDPAYDLVRALADRLDAGNLTDPERMDQERYALYLRHYRAATLGTDQRATPEPRTLEEQVAATLAVYDAKADDGAPGVPMTHEETVAAIERYLHGD